MMLNESVWPAMAEAFEAAEGSLARRLMAALDGAEAAGGDARGRQSAALLVVPARGEEWDRFELRVEDDPEPLEELRRLLAVREAYDLAEKADEAMGEGRHDDAARYGAEALELQPDNHELLFWSGLGMAQSGDLDGGLKLVRRAIELRPSWAQLLGRLEPAIAPSAGIVGAALAGEAAPQRAE
jgi:tetratricopeptide (TPR) repeat protein